MSELHLNDLELEDVMINSAPVVPDASSGDGILRTKEQCAAWAQSVGCICVEASDKELFVDLDSDEQFKKFNEQIGLLKKHFYFLSVDIQPSKSGLPHRHVKIQMAQAYPLLVRIALQACLGSDLTRELLSVRRALDLEDNVVIFFEKEVV